MDQVQKKEVIRMKKQRLVTTVLVAVFASMMVLGCITNSSFAAQERKSKLRFVFIPKVVHPWYDMVIEGARECANWISKSTGQEVVIDYIAPPQADVLLHNDTIERAIATRPDGLAVAILDAATNAPLLETAMERGIPTIIYDSVPPKEGMEIVSIGCDYVKQGAQMAEEVAKMLNYEGEIGILIGCPTAPNHQLRVEGIKEVVAKYPKMEIVAEGIDNDDIEQATNAAARIIAAHPEIDGMIGSNAAAPIGIGIAIREAGKKGEIAFAGEEDLPEMLKQVEEGIAACTSVQRTRQIGWWSCLILWHYTEGRPVPQKVDTGSFMVYPEDLSVFREWL